VDAGPSPKSRRTWSIAPGTSTKRGENMTLRTISATASVSVGGAESARTPDPFHDSDGEQRSHRPPAQPSSSLLPQNAHCLARVCPLVGRQKRPRSRATYASGSRPTLAASWPPRTARSGWVRTIRSADARSVNGYQLRPQSLFRSSRKPYLCQGRAASSFVSPVGNVRHLRLREGTA
jgi:hypothetical protein